MIRGTISWNYFIPLCLYIWPSSIFVIAFNLLIVRTRVMARRMEIEWQFCLAIFRRMHEYCCTSTDKLNDTVKGLDFLLNVISSTEIHLGVKFSHHPQVKFLVQIFFFFHSFDNTRTKLFINRRIKSGITWKSFKKF